MEREKNQLKSSMRWLLGIVSFLLIVGLVFIFSSSSIFAMEKFGYSYHFLKKQIIYLGIGLIGFVICAIIPISFWKKSAPYLFLGSLAAVLLTLWSPLSIKVHGSHRWLFFGGFSFQPSELLKFSLFIYMGMLLERKQDTLTSFLKTYVPLLGIVGLTVFILLRQPDFGMGVTIFATALMVLFVAGVRSSHLIATIACAIPVLAAIIFFVSYRLHRILIFLNPWLDPRGKGYQIIQSLIAIGSGGMWGVGISNSKQKFFYLPMQHTDFIFSIIAEETGYIGSILILLGYVLFCYFGLKIVSGLKSPFAYFTTLGFVILLSLQAVINLMVVTGLVPTKGLGLPFISYGGSALICNLCMIGLIVGFVREQ
jgi:cell division protein FtsW